jgi:hypothetical protein
MKLKTDKTGKLQVPLTDSGFALRVLSFETCFLKPRANYTERQPRALITHSSYITYYLD